MSEWKAKGKGESDEWYTPKYIFDAMEETFDIDVACPPEGPRYTPCKNFISENSLKMKWSGFVFMNPPYGNMSVKIEWLTKFFEHGNGVALMPDRTSAPWFHYALEKCDIVVFLLGKVKFERPDGTIGESPGNGTCLFGAGKRADNCLRKAARKGLGFGMNPSFQDDCFGSGICEVQ